MCQKSSLWKQRKEEKVAVYSMSSSNIRDLQRELENKANDLNKLQKGNHLFTILFHFFTLYTFLLISSKSLIFFFFFADIAKNHQVRKKYTIQLGENELVLKVPFYVF